jgi:nucleolar protein 14
MPPSQLKRLKASLRAEGLLGPQGSKAQKKRDRASGARQDKRVHREVALRNIREQFNPFESQPLSRSKGKYDITNAAGTAAKPVKARPGHSKSLGEEKVRGETFTSATEILLASLTCRRMIN